MAVFSIKYLVVLQWAFAVHSGCFQLDITKKGDYLTNGKEVKVQKVNLEDNVYSHNFKEPLLLSDIVENGESVLFDKLFFREQPVKYATVFWENNDPSIVHIYTDLSTVVLMNNGNGRMFEQTILSDNFVTNSKEETHPTTEKQVTLDLRNNNNYSSSGVGVHVTQVHKFDQGLKPYKVTYQNVDSFRLKELKYNNSTLNIPLDDEVHGVYVYSKEDQPLLVELVSSTSAHKYYLKGESNNWEHVLLPSIFDPMYNHYFMKKLKSLDYNCTYDFTLDLSLTRAGRHNVSVGCIVKGKDKTMQRVLQIQTKVYPTFVRYIGSVQKVTYQLDPKINFNLKSVRFENGPINLQLPKGPFTSVTMYFFKCPLIVHFEGPSGSPFYEYEKGKPFKSYKPKKKNDEREMKKKIDQIIKDNWIKSIFFKYS